MRPQDRAMPPTASREAPLYDRSDWGRAARFVGVAEVAEADVAAEDVAAVAAADAREMHAMDANHVADCHVGSVHLDDPGPERGEDFCENRRS